MHTACKDCYKKNAAIYRDELFKNEENIEKKRAYSRAYYKANLDKAKAYRAKYYKTYKNEILEYAKIWRARNPDYNKRYLKKREANSVNS